METILLTFVAVTAFVLFFGATVAMWIGKIIEEDSDRIIREAQKKETDAASPLRHQTMPPRHQSSLSSPHSRPRTYLDKRQSPPFRG